MKTVINWLARILWDSWHCRHTPGIWEYQPYADRQFRRCTKCRRITDII